MAAIPFGRGLAGACCFERSGGAPRGRLERRGPQPRFSTRRTAAHPFSPPFSPPLLPPPPRRRAPRSGPKTASSARASTTPPAAPAPNAWRRLCSTRPWTQCRPWACRRSPGECGQPRRRAVHARRHVLRWRPSVMRPLPGCVACRWAAAARRVGTLRPGTCRRAYLPTCLRTHLPTYLTGWRGRACTSQLRRAPPSSQLCAHLAAVCAAPRHTACDVMQAAHSLHVM